MADHVDELASTVPVIAETAWILLDRAGPPAQQRFVATIATGRLHAIDLEPGDWERIAELVETYADISLDIIDASSIAVAERLDQRAVATLDERDFRIVRPRHADAFTLLPGPA